MNYEQQIAPGQSGIASFAILTMIVLGAIILWELNEAISGPSQPDLVSVTESAKDPGLKCLSGIPSDCNDSNDVFLLPD